MKNIGNKLYKILLITFLTTITSLSSRVGRKGIYIYNSTPHKLEIELAIKEVTKDYSLIIKKINPGSSYHHNSHRDIQHMYVRKIKTSSQKKIKNESVNIIYDASLRSNPIKSFEMSCKNITIKLIDDTLKMYVGKEHS